MSNQKIIVIIGIIILVTAAALGAVKVAKFSKPTSTQQQTRLANFNDLPNNPTSTDGTVIVNSPGKAGFKIEVYQPTKIQSTGQTEVLKMTKTVGYTSAKITKYSSVTKQTTPIKISDIPLKGKVTVTGFSGQVLKDKFNASEIIYWVD
jgi:hypothetical protein